jgi:hypothetical protein
MHVSNKNFILIKHSYGTIAETNVDRHRKALGDRNDQYNYCKRKIFHQLLNENSSANLVVDACLNNLNTNTGTQNYNRKQTS